MGNQELLVKKSNVLPHLKTGPLTMELNSAPALQQQELIHSIQVCGTMCGGRTEEKEET